MINMYATPSDVQAVITDIPLILTDEYAVFLAVALGLIVGILLMWRFRS